MTIKTGINNFQLKILGLILMTFDHFSSFLTIQTPIFFKWLGRPVATIFLFLSAEGYYHTKNKTKYLTRLFIAFCLMNIGNFVLESLFPVNDLVLYPNIFGAIFCGVFAMFLFDSFKNSLKNKKYLNTFLIILFTIIWILFGFMIIPIMLSNLFLGRLLYFLLPLPLNVEGGILYVILALLLYIFRNKRTYQITSIILIWLIPLILNFGQNIFTINYQWMAIFSIIPIYFYNGEKGKSMKYFFYLYYPLHIYVIYLISYFISK